MRLTSLDVFRGITIATMILVNNPGSWNHVYPLLLHAKWHGYTPTDLVFPFFLFIAGTAMAFSLSKYAEKNQATAQVYWRIVRRCALLFLIGLLLNAYSSLAFSLANSGFPSSSNINNFSFLPLTPPARLTSSKYI